MEQLSIPFPTWYIALCVLLGLAVAAVLYFRETNFRKQASWLPWLMGGLRFFSITLISMFLLSPLLKSLELETREPVVVIAQDVSESIQAAFSEDAATSYRNELTKLVRTLDESYDVQTLSFGSVPRNALDTAFTDKVTNISAAMQQIEDQYSGANLGAVILATDGIFNEGSNPLYQADQLAVPVFSVALGDTTPQRDLVLKRAFYNRITYLEDKFSVELDFSARNLAGRQTQLVVYKMESGEARRIAEKTINIGQEDFFQTEEFILDADEPGVLRYRFVLQPLAGEVSRQNNSKEIFVDVLDARQRILILGASPHPDLTAIRQSIRTNKNYEVEVAYAESFQEAVADYDFVILHQLPSQKYRLTELINQLNENRIPRLFVLGSQTDFGQVNQVQSLLGIRANARNTNEVQGRLNPAFSLFNVADDLQREFNAYPPLTAAFGEYSDSGNGQVLLYQRIRRIDTQYPLLIMGNEQGTKTGVLTAEGIWKWRLFDFLQNQNHETFDGFFSRVVQYLGVKEDKRKFRVSMSDNIVDENEPVYFDAELYNNAYQLVNGPDVSMKVTDESGNTFEYIFNKTDKAYRLNAGSLPVGNYRYQAEVTFNGERLTASGPFIVRPIQLELYETTADHSLLRLLSDRTGGALFFPQELEALGQRIQEFETIKPVIYQSSRTRSAINLRWLFLPLLLLLAVEWGLRRYFGAY